MAKRQFPEVHVAEPSRDPAYAQQVSVHGNRAGLEHLRRLIDSALEDKDGCRDEAGQARYGCKHGQDQWITLTVRNDDIFNALPRCPRCKGTGFKDGLCCAACRDTGKKMPEHCLHDLPFFT